MTDPRHTVFISYRRRASSFVARSIYQDLRAHQYDVFMDVTDIDAGQFESIILNQVAARAHFLVILTPGTVENFSSEDDWMRREIEHAIATGRNVVPVTALGCTMNDVKPHLPKSLKKLAGFNAVDIPVDYFDEAMTKLRDRFLRVADDAINVTPPPSTDAAAVRRKIRAADKETTMTTDLGRFIERVLRDVDICSPDVTLLLFDKIAGNPTYLADYETLGGKRSNATIARVIKALVGRETTMRINVPKRRNRLLRSYSRFEPCP